MGTEGLMDYPELERLAVEAETQAQQDALAKRLEDENGWTGIASYAEIEIIRAKAEGREPILE